MYQLGKSGVCICDQSFIPENLMENQLIGENILVIAGLLWEFTNSKQKLQLLDLGNFKILLEYSTYIIAALMTEVSFCILGRKLRQLMEGFEF